MCSNFKTITKKTVINVSKEKGFLPRIFAYLLGIFSVVEYEFWYSILLYPFSLIFNLDRKFFVLKLSVVNK